MSKIKFGWGSPVYEEVYDFRRRCKVNRIIAPCRECHMLTVTIHGELAFAREAFHLLYNALYAYDNTAVISGTLPWGVPESYDEATATYINTICIDKQYDNLAEQKKAILDYARQQARTLPSRTRHMKRVCKAA